MSDAQNDTKATGRTLEELAADDAFERLYSNWLAARANLYDPDQPSSTMDGRLQRTCDAARELSVTPSSLPWMVWQKWEVLEYFLDEEKLTGPWTDNRIVVALACVKADLMRFRIIEEAS
jgi:hypothetical protein